MTKLNIDYFMSITRTWKKIMQKNFDKHAMNYEDIKTYNERCEMFQGIVTNERVMEILIDEIEQLRDYIEAKRKPLTDEEIATLLSQSAGVDMKLNGGDLLFARAIEQAHGIGNEE